MAGASIMQILDEKVRAKMAVEWKKGFEEGYLMIGGLGEGEREISHASQREGGGAKYCAQPVV